jgi:hypothetical protein
VIKWGKMRWAKHVEGMGKRRGVYRGLVGNPEGKSPLRRHWRRYEDNIKMDVQAVVCGCMDWIELAQDKERWQAFVNAVMKFRVPLNAGKFLTISKAILIYIQQDATLHDLFYL